MNARARAGRSLLAACLLIGLLPASAGAVDIWDGGDGRSLSLGVTLRWTTILSHAPDAPALYPERWSATSLWRARLNLDARVASWVSFEFATVERARLVSEGAGAAGGSAILPEGADTPYRYFDARSALVGIGETYGLTHDIDRASLTIMAGPVGVTAGRQAVGWGRGVLFSAIDLFVPFSPLESDREWRAGVDAIRATLPLTDLVSAELVAVGGASDEQSALAVRVFGYMGSLDGECAAGRRGDDRFAGLSLSLPLGGTELHGEAAVFRLPDGPAGAGWREGDDVVAQAVLGASYSFDVAGGLYLLGEYHYSGFGVDDIEDAADRLADPDYAARAARGDFSVLGRHACAAQVVLGLSGPWSLGLSWVGSPVDGSGVFTPSWTWLLSDSVTLEARGYVAHGDEPDGHILMSEYGAVPTSVLARISFYY